jgi:hypothetical protein
VRLGRAPLVCGMAITLADPGGPVEALKESTAALQTLIEASKDDTYGAFVQEVARDVAERAQNRENPLAGFKPDRQNTAQAVLDELRGVEYLLRTKATEQEHAEFREFLRVAAQRTALAAREGGFLGIGGERVSEREQEMLETIGDIFGAPRTDPSDLS